MKDTRTPSEQVADGYNKVAHGIPYDRELAAMTYKQLAIELQKHEPGCAAYLLVQREMKLKENPAIWSKPWFIWTTTVTLAILGLAAKFLN